MQQMDPQQQGQHEAGDVEYIKVGKNTKAHNWDYKIIRKPGQEWRDVLAEMDDLEAELVRRYGV